MGKMHGPFLRRRKAEAGVSRQGYGEEGAFASCFDEDCPGQTGDNVL